MNRFKPYAVNRAKQQTKNYDRHCQNCGILIKGAAHQKPLSCFKCKEPQEGRHGWDPEGWGRCAECDAWIKRNHCYCLCGHANFEAVQRKKMQQEAARQQAAFKKDQETLELKRLLGEAERINMALQQQIDVREAEERDRENHAIFVEQMRGVNLEEEQNEQEIE